MKFNFKRFGTILATLALCCSLIFSLAAPVFAAENDFVEDSTYPQAPDVFSVSGYFVFNETIDFTSSLGGFYEVNFEFDGVAYNIINIDSVGGYIFFVEGSDPTEIYSPDSGWISGAPTINFGTDPQYVDFDLSNFLFGNGSFQGPPPPSNVVEAVERVDMTTVLLQVVNLLPIALVVLVGFIGLRKGIAFVRGILQGA